MCEDLYDTTLSLTLPLTGNLWRPPAGPRHRAPRNYRKPLTVALVTLLGILATLVTVAVFLSVHRYGYGSALNGGYYWHTPFTPRGWTVGYETYGTPGWFAGDAN